MRWLNSRFLFSINQELAALCATEDRIFTCVECFFVGQDEFPTSAQFPKVSVDHLLKESRDITSILPRRQEPPPEHFKLLREAISLSFPDYDFSTIEQTHFRPIDAPEEARASLFWTLSSALQVNDRGCYQLWQSLDSEICPAVCDIYSYEPDCGDAFSENGALWNQSLLFFNTKQRKLLLFHVRKGACDPCDEMFDPILDFEEEYGFRAF